MKIIKQAEDFRGWLIFTVKTIRDKEQIEKYFEELYPDNDVSALELMNLRNTWEVTLLPKEDFVESEN
jgi:hypothetical protein